MVDPKTEEGSLAQRRKKKSALQSSDKKEVKHKSFDHLPVDFHEILALSPNIGVFFDITVTDLMHYAMGKNLSRSHRRNKK
jgi:hypothetical protein